MFYMSPKVGGARSMLSEQSEEADKRNTSDIITKDDDVIELQGEQKHLKQQQDM